jgi:serine/threonine-protein kinase HipA
VTRPPLAAWLYGTRVASLAETTTGRLTLVWTDEAIDRWGLNSRVVSCLLPVDSAPPHPARVRAWVNGLLPEGSVRRYLAGRAGVEGTDVFGLVTAYGRDPAGALVFQDPVLPAPSARGGTLTAATETELGAALRSVLARTAPRIVGVGVGVGSLAGVQPKLTMARSDGGWFWCADGAVSTHLLKPVSDTPEGRAHIAGEAASLIIAAAVGLDAARAEVSEFDGVPTLVVRRYDRLDTSDGVERLHQEDTAQALGLNTDEPERKFQFGRALPSLKVIAELLRGGRGDVLALLSFATLTVLLRNVDAHAKNVSLLHPSTGRVSLAPVYDAAPFLQAPPQAAMDVNGVTDIDLITLADLATEGASWGVSRATARARVEEVSGAFAQHLDVFPESIGQRLADRCRRLGAST